MIAVFRTGNLDRFLSFYSSLGFVISRAVDVRYAHLSYGPAQLFVEANPNFDVAENDAAAYMLVPDPHALADHWSAIVGSRHLTSPQNNERTGYFGSLQDADYNTIWFGRTLDSYWR